MKYGILMKYIDAYKDSVKGLPKFITFYIGWWQIRCMAKEPNDCFSLEASNLFGNQGFEIKYTWITKCCESEQNQLWE